MKQALLSVRHSYFPSAGFEKNSSEHRKKYDLYNRTSKQTNQEVQGVFKGWGILVTQELVWTFQNYLAENLIKVHSRCESSSVGWGTCQLLKRVKYGQLESWSKQKGTSSDLSVKMQSGWSISACDKVIKFPDRQFRRERLMFMFQSICVLFWGGGMVEGVVTAVILHLQSGNREG